MNVIQFVKVDRTFGVRVGCYRATVTLPAFTFGRSC